MYAKNPLIRVVVAWVDHHFLEQDSMNLGSFPTFPTLPCQNSGHFHTFRGSFLLVSQSNTFAAVLSSHHRFWRYSKTEHIDIYSYFQSVLILSTHYYNIFTHINTYEHILAHMNTVLCKKLMYFDPRCWGFGRSRAVDPGHFWFWMAPGRKGWLGDGLEITFLYIFTLRWKKTDII